MLKLLKSIFFLKLPLSDRMFNFWFGLFEWAFRLSLAAEVSYILYMLFGPAAFHWSELLKFLVLLIPTYLFYAVIHFLDWSEGFFKGKE